MLLKLYCVYDSKAAEYMAPYNSRNNQTAIREFETAVTSEGHIFNNHAHDYSLHLVGEFDSEKGAIRACSPESIARAHELQAIIGGE